MNGLKVSRISNVGVPLPNSVEITATYPSADEADFDGTPGVAGATQWKEPVRAATTASITIATALNAGDTLDGVTLAAGDRVLVKDQGTASQNGIYVVDATPYRAGDMDDDTEVLGAVVYVIAGTANAGTSWKVTNTAATVVDTDAINFAAFGGSTSFGTPAIVLGTAAAAGAATTAVRTDATIVAFDATAPTTQALGDAAATGSAAVAARRDHKHAMPAAAVTTSGLTQATGKLLGRSTAGTGAIEEITVGTGLSLSGGSLAATGSGGSITVEEVDGSPTDSAVTKIVFPNGTLGIASHVATYTPAAGGNSANFPGLPTGTLDHSYTFASTVESWTNSAGSASSTGGRLRVTHTAAVVALEPAGTYPADGEVVMDVWYPDAANGPSFGIIFRAVDTSNFYLWIVDNNTGTGSRCELYKCVSGSFTSLAQYNGATNTPRFFFGGTSTPTISGRIMIRYAASVLSLYVNGAHIMTVYDTTYTAAGKVGIRIDGGGSSRSWEIDNVKVYTTPSTTTGNVTTP